MLFQSAVFTATSAQSISQVDRKAEADRLLQQGIQQRASAQYQEAIASFEAALAIYQEINDQKGEGETLSFLGVVYMDLGQFLTAAEYLERGAAVGSGNDVEADSTPLPINTSDVCSFSNLETNNQISKSYQDVGIEQYPMMISQLDTYIGYTRRDGDLIGEFRALTQQGSIHYAFGEYALAEGALRSALDTFVSIPTSELPETSQISFLGTSQNTYKHLQQALFAQNNIEQALVVSEESRAKVFEFLISDHIESNTSRPLILNALSIEDIKKIAQQQNATLIEYTLVDKSSLVEPVVYIWVVQPSGEIFARTVDLSGEALLELICSTRSAVGVRGSDRASAPPQLRPDVLAQLQANQDEKLSQLHDLLIEPIADLLPDDPNQPVVFIPQDELFLVPFPALKDDNGDYLIENHTILTAPSIQVLQLTHDIADARDGATTDRPIIVGNPAMPTVTFLTEGGFVDTQLSPLYGALQEANAVSEFLGTSALTGDQATEATVKQQLASADLIHLATHGLLEYGDPRETGTRDVPGAIALAPGSGEDGLLTSAEILRMDLQADLVVLSACDTGRGRITGDGVIGLSRSFIAAGVPSVVVSLWAVPDAPTADLMTEFYRQLDQGQTKAQALRQAMLMTMQDHPDPKDWAAFTLIGESE
ncbi:MAG: CHAT domain-containing protein [Leptolyngbya sp. SIOISBB]|nr:CHAT domain-containing protein [Leptolyngbya sp. SIOISBB]